MAQGYAGVPAGPLSAYLGVRGANEASDMEKLGFLAKLQQVEQARRENEAFRRDQLSARVEGQREAITSREGIAADQRANVAEMSRQRAEDQQNLTRLAASLRQPQQEPAPSMIVVQDPASPTGWSHRNMRNGQIVPGAAPPAAAAKASDKEEGLKKGKEQVSQILGNLNAQYRDLQVRGAIADTSKGTAYNVARSVTSSGAGQLAGRVVGTETQGIRNQINMTRPLLMNAIRQATGQTAKSLDSNVELQFYLQAATNPAVDIQSNLAALSHLDKLYGLGIGVEADPKAIDALRKQAPKAVPLPTPTGIDPKVWDVMTPEEKALWK